MHTGKGTMTYTGVRTPTGVTVTNGEGRPVTHIAKQSPEGFEWGYQGSGPLDLAYSILSDFGGAALAEVIYRQFAETVIAALPHHGWTLTAEQIAAFLVDSALAEGA